MRADTGAEQGFVGIDVAGTYDYMIIHDDQLDGCAAFTRGAVEIVRRKIFLQRLRPEFDQQQMLRRIAFVPQYCTETARIAQPHQQTVSQHQIEVIMFFYRRTSGQDAQAAAHAEVKD